MRIIPTALPGVVVIQPDRADDRRGYFVETWNQRRYTDAGLPESFVQDNLSFSRQGVLRGLHFQCPNAQGKLVYVIQGEILDVAVDVRVGSPTFGSWVAETLSGANMHQFFIPEGFAHGFCVTSNGAWVCYKCTRSYSPADERGVAWNDEDLMIDWPIRDPMLSVRDKGLPRLSGISPARLPQYVPPPQQWLP